jgi:hypothetical protein
MRDPWRARGVVELKAGEGERPTAEPWAFGKGLGFSCRWALFLYLDDSVSGGEGNCGMGVFAPVPFFLVR